jgi:C-terminal processing protease CtpA/Prc
MYVTHDFSSSNRITPGTEIQLINGLSVSFLYDILISRQIRDGENLTYPNWILERWFNTYYSYHMGNPSNYQLVLRHPDGRNEYVTIEGLTRDSISYYRQLRYGASEESTDPKGLTLSIDETQRMAVMTIKDFHTSVLKKTYKQQFKKIIADFFQQIQDRHIAYLILDLRDNQGGDMINGQILLSHLLDKPFQVVRGYAKVDPKTYTDPLIRLKPAKGAGTSLYQPRAERFHGELYVLINGGSFSNSGIVSSVLRAHQRATFIGEETGGNPAMLSAGGKYFLLPNTKTQVLIPTHQYDIQGRLANTGRGLMPDHPIRPLWRDIVNQVDPELQFTLDLIQQKRMH